MITTLLILVFFYTLYHTYNGSGFFHGPVRDPDINNGKKAAISNLTSDSGIMCYVCESFSNFDDQNITISYGSGVREGGLRIPVRSNCRQRQRHPINNAVAHSRQKRGRPGKSSKLKLSLNDLSSVLFCPEYTACATMSYYEARKGKSFQRICYNYKQDLGCHFLGDVEFPSIPMNAISESAIVSSDNHQIQRQIGMTEIKIKRLVKVNHRDQMQDQHHNQVLVASGITSAPLTNLSANDSILSKSRQTSINTTSLNLGKNVSIIFIGENRESTHGKPTIYESPHGSEIWENVRICVCQTERCNTISESDMG